MRNDLPISPKKKFKYSITFESWDEESLEAGQSDVRGYEIEDEIDTIGDILYKANTTYGIYYPLSFGGWESTEPEEDRDFWEKGIRKYYALHITNEDGTEISQEENDFITYLLSDGRYEIDKFRDYAVGGIVLGSIAIGVGALITYFYFKGKKSSKGKSNNNNRAKSVTHTIKGKDRKFPIKDAWKKEHSIENKSEEYEVPQADRFEMGGDASEYYHEIEYGEGGVARAKEIITKKIGYNEESADYFVSKSEKFAIWLADAILKQELKQKNYTKEQYLKSNVSSWGSINFQYGNSIREILDWLQHPFTPKQDLRNLTFNQALEKAREWHNELQVLGGDIDFTEPEKNTILKKYPKNSDGVEYYWVFIPSNYCDLESSRMGHCGRTGYGNNLISLRSVKPYGKGHTINDSHITIAYGVNDGFFYQVKGKKNNKPAEKYFPYIFDLIKTFITDDATSINSVSDVVFDFSGFGSEYGQSEDYGYEDMTNDEIKELYQLKPSLFEDTEGYLMLFDNGIISNDELKVIVEENPETFESPKNQLRLYNAGIVDTKPSFVFELSENCNSVVDLLNVRGYRDDIVEKILCGDFDELYDGWSYYYENPSDLVDNLNKENEQRVIDEIVRITGLDESVVNENGIEHYLNGDDEDFPQDDFDNIIRALASAQNSADNSDYYNYLYGELKNSLEELGEVHSLNDEGVKMTIDLTNFNFTEEELVQYMEDYDMSDIIDLFYELKASGDIDLPSLSIDERYSPYGSSEDFNEYISGIDLEQGYEKGGSLRPTNTKLNKKNKIKNMKPNQRKLAQGGSIDSTGISKEDYFLVVQNWVYFTFNYPMGFVKDAFNWKHLEEKFSSSYTRYGSVGVLMSFWANLDNENRRILSLWIKNNYFNSSSLKTKLQSISDDNYAKIITHWNMFCFNYPYKFIESVFGDTHLLEHFESKFLRAYESAGSTGAVNKFFTELSSNNQELLTDWVYDNYKGVTFAGGGSADEKYVLPHISDFHNYILQTYGFVISNKEDDNYTYSDFADDIKKTYSLENPRNKKAYDYLKSLGDLRMFNTDDMIKVNNRMSEINVEYAGGGRVTTNEGIIEAFLTSNKELKVGNLSTHYNQYDDFVLLRNYHTLIAIRKGNDVSITNTKYSNTTTTITNKVRSMALNKRMNVNYVDKFADGGGVTKKPTKSQLNKMTAFDLMDAMKKDKKNYELYKKALLKLYPDAKGFADGGEISMDIVKAIFDANEYKGKMETSFGDKTLEGFSEMVKNNDAYDVARAIWSENGEGKYIATMYGDKTWEGLIDMLENAKNKYAGGGEAGEEKTYQVYNHENQNVEGYFDNEIEAEEFASQFENASVYDIRQYAGGGEAGDIEIIENKKEGKIIARRTLVKKNNKGQEVTYELEVGKHTNPKDKPNRYADGWFTIEATIEANDGKDEEYFYSEGGLWFNGNKIRDYDGVYSLSEKLKPLMSALNIDSTEVYADGGETKKYAKGGMFGEGARLEYMTDAYASLELRNELKEKLGIESEDDKLEDDYVISFAYTDYGGDFLDKVAIAYFSENYPNNIIKENAGWGGENAYVFGEPAKEWIEQTEDYPLGFEDIEDFYYEKQAEQESEDFAYFLDELTSDYSFDRDSVMDWLQENKGGYYSMTTQGLDFSWQDLTEELINEGLIEEINEDDEDDEENEDDGIEQNLQIGNIVELSESGWDNENYHDFFEGKDDIKLVITDVYKNKSQHQGFDEGMGMALYSTKRLDNGQEVPFDLYDYELDYISDGDEYAGGGEAGDWSVTDITNATYLGVIEFQDNEGEFHNFEVMETDDRLVFGGMTNSGFIESGYIEKDGFSTDEALQSLLEDLEVYYNDGAEYTSQIVFNERMAKGGKVDKKTKKTTKKKQPKMVRYYFEDKPYSYAGGGSVKGIKKKAEKLLEDSISYVWKSTDMGSGWYFMLDNPNGGVIDTALTLDIFDGEEYVSEYDDVESWDSLSKKDKKYYFEQYKEELLQAEYDYFKDEMIKQHLDTFIEYLQKDSDENFAGGGGVKNKFQEASDYWKQLESQMTPKQKKFYSELLKRRQPSFEKNFNDSEIADYINGEIIEQFGVDLGITKYQITGVNWFKLGFKYIAYREAIEEPEFWEEMNEYAGGGEADIQDGDNVIMYFKQDTELEIYESEDYELEDENYEFFKKGEKFEVDIFGVDDIKYDVQFGDGSVAFIRKNQVEIVEVNHSKYASGGEAGLTKSEISIIDDRINYYYDNEEYTDDSELLASFVIEGGEIDSSKYNQVLEYIESQKYAKGGKVDKKTKKTTKKKQPRMVRQYFEDKPYSYESGGKVRMISYYIGGLVSEEIPFEYNGEEREIMYEVGFHEGGIDAETFKETPSGYYVRINPYTNSSNIRRFVYPEKDIEIAYLSELRAITMLLFEADKDTKANQKIAIKEGKKNLPKLLKYMTESWEEEDEQNENVRKVQDAMWGSDEDEDEYAGGGSVDESSFKKYANKYDFYTDEEDNVIRITSNDKELLDKIEKDYSDRIAHREYDEYIEVFKNKYAGGGEVEEWMEEALASLIEETGYEDLEISHTGYNEFYATDGDVEYRVFKSEDEAEETAIQQVREDLEENPEYFNQDWLMYYIDGRDFFEEALNEMNDGYVQDIESESDRKYANRLIAELVENGLMDEEDAESDNAEELADELKSDYVAFLTEDKLGEGNDGLDYFINNFGEEETYRMVRDNNLIDVSEASKDAVNVDGIGHFLSSYDGETLYLSDDYVAFRVN